MITSFHILSRVITPHETLTAIFDRKVMSMKTLKFVRRLLKMLSHLVRFYDVLSHIVTSYQVLSHLVTLYPPSLI